MAKSNRTTPTEPPFIAQYRAVYPTVEKFYVTSDKQVFLNEPDAEVHREEVGGEIKTY